MNKTALEIDEHGDVKGLYTEVVDLYSLGKIVKVCKASNVEFNEAKQVWEVTSINNKVLYSHKSREAAIEWEIENFGVGGPYYEDRNL